MRHCPPETCLLYFTQSKYIHTTDGLCEGFLTLREEKTQSNNLVFPIKGLGCIYCGCLLTSPGDLVEQHLQIPPVVAERSVLHETVQYIP